MRLVCYFFFSIRCLILRSFIFFFIWIWVILGGMYILLLCCKIVINLVVDFGGVMCLFDILVFGLIEIFVDERVCNGFFLIGILIVVIDVSCFMLLLVLVILRDLWEGFFLGNDIL